MSEHVVTGHCSKCGTQVVDGDPHCDCLILGGRYPCALCGAEDTPELLWVWDDDRLLCGACTDTRWSKTKEGEGGR